jgi:hypothetical protein
MAKTTAMIVTTLIALSSVSTSAGATEQFTAQQTFAIALGSASIAERDCDIRGEARRAQDWIDQTQSGFSPHNQNDLAALTLMMARVEEKERAMGVHAWCIEYKTKMAPLLQRPH